MTADPSRRLEELERAPLDGRDFAVLDTLRAVYESGDPVPPGLVDRVKFAITLDDLEAEVARLQHDSLSDFAARSEGLLKARTVTFTSDSVTTMVTITPSTTSLGVDVVRLDGWAAPGAHLEVELRVGSAVHRVVADEDGRFVFEEVTPGLAQLVLRPSGEDEGGHPVITPAIEL